MDLNSKKVFSKIGLALAITTLVVYLSQSLLGMLFVNLTPSIASSSWISFVLIGISFYLIGFPLCSVLLKSIPDSTNIETRKFSVKDIIVLFLICYFLMITTNMITLGLLSLVSLAKGTEIVNPLQSVVSNSSLLATFLFAGILSPIVEEMLFRGLLLNKLRCYGDKIAILTTAVLFGLFHGNFSQFFYATVLGLVFAYVTLKSGSIKYSIALHIMINIMGSVVGMIVLNNTMLTGIFGLCVIIFFISGLILFIKNRKKVTLSKGVIEIEKGQVFKTTCFNFGMILNFAIALAGMIYILLL